MIFATVGTQLPFDRMIGALDRWALDRGRNDIFAQIGESELRPTEIEWANVIGPEAFSERLNSASLIIAHAGIGSIISALELGKPIIVMPRLSKHGEHRNDHQLATARRFRDKPLVSVAWDEAVLRMLLDRWTTPNTAAAITPKASPTLIAHLRQFIAAGRV